MASIRYIIKDRLERASSNTEKAIEYLREDDVIFSKYGERYGKYLELIRSIAELLNTAKEMIDKLNDNV